MNPALIALLLIWGVAALISTGQFLRWVRRKAGDAAMVLSAALLAFCGLVLALSQPIPHPDSMGRGHFAWIVLSLLVLGPFALVVGIHSAIAILFWLLRRLRVK